MPWALPASDTYFASILEKTPEGFEINHLEEALKYCKNFRVAVDGGAHIGTWAVNMARRFELVIAVEPAPDTFACLKKNTKDFSNIICVEGSLGEKQGCCCVVEDPTRVGNTGSNMVDYTTGSIPVTMLDAYKIDNLDFLKLDLEGAEIFALKGALGIILCCRPTIMVECKEFKPLRNGGTTLVRKFLDNIGYREVGGIRNDRVFIPR